MEKAEGCYLGTEIEEKWWKRYTRDGLLSRGNGEYGYDDKGVYFFRYLIKEPIFIPFNAIVGIKLGTWHSGRWALGNLILKILWKKDGCVLSSGLIVSGKREDTIKIKELFQNKVKQLL